MNVPKINIPQALQNIIKKHNLDPELANTDFLGMAVPQAILRKDTPLDELALTRLGTKDKASAEIADLADAFVRQAGD